MPLKKSLFIATLMAGVASAAWAQNYSTRFGTLFIDDEHVLSFNGKPVQSSVVGNNSLTYIEKFQFGKTKDVVLVQDNGGTACPAQYHFVTLTKSGAKGTKAFGTCNEATKVSRQGDTIRVEMQGFATRFQSEAVQDKAFKEKHVFLFKNGWLTESVLPAAQTKTAFDPFTNYFPIGKPPKAFSRFQGFFLRGELAPGKVSGGILNDLSAPSAFSLQSIAVNPKQLTFSTPKRGGESFSLSGRFLKTGDLARFSTAPDSPNKTAVLEGTVRRYWNGKQTASTPMKFFVESAAG
ncbi:hypothetical protein EON80_06535 [bacterium]|nr:MAG: hypothetical protein EON80_06535 [bacterium]